MGRLREFQVFAVIKLLNFLDQQLSSSCRASLLCTSHYFCHKHFASNTDYVYIVINHYTEDALWGSQDITCPTVSFPTSRVQDSNGSCMTASMKRMPEVHPTFRINKEGVPKDSFGPQLVHESRRWAQLLHQAPGSESNCSAELETYWNSAFKKKIPERNHHIWMSKKDSLPNPC